MTFRNQSKKARKGDWHKADIKAALEKRGWSLRALSAHHGYNETVLCIALRKPYPKAERLIAEAIGVHPMKIWPSRYDKDGNQIATNSAKSAAMAKRRNADRHCRTARSRVNGDESKAA